MMIPGVYLDLWQFQPLSLDAPAGASGSDISHWKDSGAVSFDPLITGKSSL